MTLIRQQKTDTLLIKVLKISTFSGFILYIPLTILYLFLWWLSNSPSCAGSAGTENINYGALTCFAGLGLVNYGVGPFVWLASTIFLGTSFRRLGVPKVTLIVASGIFTFLVGTVVITGLVDSLIESMFLVPLYTSQFILILYPLIYGGYYLLFNRFLSTFEKK